MYRTIATAPYGSDSILFDAPSFEDFKYSDYRPGYLYVVTRALASRINANLDLWPIEELRESYKSFLGRPAHVEHNNAYWKKAKGIIADVLYRETKTASNYKEGAVYLLIEVDAKSFPKLARAIVDGKIKGVSMGADIAYSRCTICGNKAETPAQYCWHLRHKGQILTDTVNGRKVTGLVAESCHKISFFEISFVFDPADESAWILSKKYIPESRISYHNFINQSPYINVGRTGMVKAASKQVLSEELMRLPERVNFSENLNCPVCGEAWDGMSCENCGLEAPPEGFEDPDLEYIQNENSEEDHNVDPDESTDDPNGAEVPNPNIDQWDGDKPLRESRTKTGERMSRFNELTATTRSAAHPGNPVNPRSKAKYDQTSTINLDSWGVGEQADAPQGDVGFTNDEFTNSHGHDIDVLDLDAAATDLDGGPGGNAVRVKARPVTRNSRKRAVSPRIARRLKADVDDLVNQAQDNVAQVKDALGDLNDESRNVETSEDLGAVDQQLSQLEQTLEELGEVAATPVADPNAGLSDGGGESAQEPPAPEEVAPEAADVAERAARKVKKARKLVRAAIRILADDDIEDEEADDQVNSLIDEVEDEVNDVDNDVREVDSDQMSDDARHESSRKTARAKRLAQARIVKRNKAIAQVRAARKQIIVVQAGLRFADEDEYGDEKVDEDLEELDKDLGEAEQSVEELEGGQEEDEAGDEDPRFARKSRGLFRRARKASKTDRLRKAHALVKSAYAKFAEEDDEGVERDLEEADDELEKAEDDLQSDADAEETSEDEDTREAARRRARRYLAASDDADDNGDDSEEGDDAEESEENEEVEDSDSDEGETGDNSPEDDSSWTAGRRANTRSATNGNQETDSTTDVRDLDSGFSNTKEDMMNPLRVNVTVPTDVGDGTGDADTPTFFNGSEYDQEAPASKKPYPGSEPGAYDYREENQQVAASKEHLFRSFNLVDKMISLGMVHSANKMRHVADYEKLSPERLAGIEEAIALVEKSGVRKVQSQVITANRNRTPDLGRSASKPSGNTDGDVYVDFLP